MLWSLGYKFNIHVDNYQATLRARMRNLGAKTSNRYFGALVLEVMTCMFARLAKASMVQKVPERLKAAEERGKSKSMLFRSSCRALSFGVPLVSLVRCVGVGKGNKVQGTRYLGERLDPSTRRSHPRGGIWSRFLLEQGDYGPCSTPCRATVGMLLFCSM